MERNIGVHITKTKQLFPVKNFLQLARAYKPVSRAFMPRWRNIGKAILPYHFMQPVLIPIDRQRVQNKPRP